MSKPIKPVDDLLQRILQAIERITSGHAPMRIPADMRDADIVLSECSVRIEADAAKIKALELERDTIQEYADRIGANLTAAEGTLAERDEQIAQVFGFVEVMAAMSHHVDPCVVCGHKSPDHFAGCSVIVARELLARRKEARG